MSVRCIHVLVFGMALCASNVQAQETSFSLTRWASEGRTKWNHDASFLNPLYGNPSSELDYQNLKSDVVEFGIRTQLKTGHDLQIHIGLGEIKQGLLVDDDYLSAQGAVYYSATQTGEHRFSRTHSDINGDALFYLKGTITPKNLVFRPSFGLIRFSVGGQYWTEQYRAYGITQVECTTLTLCDPAGTVGYQGVNVITNKLTWVGVSAEMDGMLGLAQGLVFKFKFVFLPILSLDNEDTHHLRTDLAQNPSIRMEGSGYGYDAELGLAYYFSNTVSAHLGYRNWVRQGEDQTITFYSASGGSSTAHLNEFTTTRNGLTIGIDMVF